MTVNDGRVQVQKRVSMKLLDTTQADGDGTFSALVSTFGNMDAQGEVIEPGAFTKSLSDLGEDGTVPILWDHQWDDIFAHIGAAKATQTDEGLVVDGTLDLSNPTAAQAFKLMQSGRVKEFSIGGFESPENVTTDDQGVRHVAQFDLAEVSLTLRGANPDTRLLDVKSNIPTLKEGRVLAAKHVEALKNIHAQLADIIAAVDTDDSAETKHEDDETASSKSVTSILAALNLASLGPEKGDSL